jgi:hypothetical protein
MYLPLLHVFDVHIIRTCCLTCVLFVLLRFTNSDYLPLSSSTFYCVHCICRYKSVYLYSGISINHQSCTLNWNRTKKNILFLFKIVKSRKFKLNMQSKYASKLWDIRLSSVFYFIELVLLCCIFFFYFEKKK